MALMDIPSHPDELKNRYINKTYGSLVLNFIFITIFTFIVANLDHDDSLYWIIVIISFGCIIWVFIDSIQMYIVYRKEIKLF